MDFKNMNPEQEKIVQDIWSVCTYFHQMRLADLSDDILAKQAKEIGWKMQQLEEFRLTNRRFWIPDDSIIFSGLRSGVL